MKSAIGFVLFSISFLVSGNIHAQNIRVGAGKKFSLVYETKTVSTTSMMGQDVTVSTTGTSIIDNEVKAVRPDGYTMLSTIKSISGSMNGMGEVQSFDSEIASDRNRPELAEAFKQIGQPLEIVVANGKEIDGVPLNTNPLARGGNIGFDAGKLVLDLPKSQMLVGHSWEDSVISEVAKVHNYFTITRIDGEELEIAITTLIKTNGSIQQAGMEVKQQMEGKVTGNRIYQKSDGLLKMENTNVEMTGTAEMMGMNVPLNIKGTILVKVS